MNIMLKSQRFELYQKKSKLTDTQTKAATETTKKDIMKETVQKMKEAIENSGFKTEEDKKKFEEKLNEKIKSGAKLSASEMSYLQRTNPMMYACIKRIQMQRELLENRLKQCRSKKEVEETCNQAMASISKKDPNKELVMKAYDNVIKEFKKTKEYKQLPKDLKDKEDEKNRMKNGSRHMIEDETVPSFSMKC